MIQLSANHIDKLLSILLHRIKPIVYLVPYTQTSPHRMDGWMIRDFTSFSTVFQS